MQTIDELIHDHEFFAGLPEPVVTFLAGCAVNEHHHPGDVLFSTDEPADRFYLVRRGRVALEVTRPGTPSIVIETLDGGDVVGWSWLVPPYRWYCDARVVQPTDLISFDAKCLRDKCEADPSVGYALLQRVAHVMHERLEATRVRLLDLYGSADARPW